jgi:predicted CopG family antitoxin
MRTTISLSPETKEKLSSRGKHGESYEDIIKRLINTNINLEDLKEIIKNL